GSRRDRSRYAVRWRRCRLLTSGAGQRASSPLRRGTTVSPWVMGETRAAVHAGGRAAGVVAASAGNHGLAVAHGATRLGIPATIVVPRTASAAKVAALADFPVDLVQHGDDYDGAEPYAISLAVDGLAFISPYNDPNVIAGQATIGHELSDELTPPFTIVAPSGGGGVGPGLGLGARAAPGVRVVGV